MTNRPPVRVQSFRRPTVAEAYQLFLTAVGYEQRSRFIAETKNIDASVRVALGFPDEQVFSYRENAAWFEQAGYEVKHLTDEQFGTEVSKRLNDLEDDQKKSARICVDISSLNRRRMAMIVDELRLHTLGRDIKVDFMYALAKFSPPPDAAGGNTHVGPILPSFAGWWTEPELPTAAIVGLGYEQYKALGAVEHIEPAEIWAFMPHSDIKEYIEAQRAANQTLLDSLKPECQVPYRVDNAFDTFVLLESLVFGISKTANVVLLPFGPKIFALICLLVAALHPSVGVWRVSAKGIEKPNDRVGAGQIVGLSASFLSSALRQPSLDRLASVAF
jgi:hypothetical protein